MSLSMSSAMPFAVVPDRTALRSYLLGMRKAEELDLGRIAALKRLLQQEEALAQEVLEAFEILWLLLFCAQRQGHNALNLKSISSVLKLVPEDYERWKLQSVLKAAQKVDWSKNTEESLRADEVDNSEDSAENIALVPDAVSLEALIKSVEEYVQALVQKQEHPLWASSALGVYALNAAVEAIPEQLLAENASSADAKKAENTENTEEIEAVQTGEDSKGSNENWQQKLLIVNTLPGMGQEGSAIRFALPADFANQWQAWKFFRSLDSSAFSGISAEAEKENFRQMFRESFRRSFSLVQTARYKLALPYEPHYRQFLAAVLGNWQKRFLLISGGPGTGKTTVAKLVLAAIYEESLQSHADSSRRTENAAALHPEEVILAAPTGRARARLYESMQKDLGAGNENYQQFFAQLKSRTLHSLLGIGLWREVRPLQAKVVIVDEASMMDSHMFARLLQSLPENCRLLLLGDKDQLPSVGPGQVLADLSAPFQQEKGTLSSALAQEFCELGKQYYEQRKAQLVQAEEPSLTASLEHAGWSELQTDNEVSLHSSLSMQEVLQNKVVFLTQSQRVGSAIWQWWEQVQQSGRAPVDNDYSASGASGASALAFGKVVGKAVRTLCWGSGDLNELAQTHPYLLEEFVAPYREVSEFLRREKPTVDARHRIDHESLYQKMNELLIRQKVLTSHRHGPFGALLFNQQAVEYIAQKKTPRSGLPLLSGMPVMITRNQRLSGYEISNGDLGFLMSKRQGGREDWFCLLPADGLVLALPLGQLHGWEYAFAITVHKSQGSEFRKVAFFSTTSPDSPLWTRQMVYTAITRAKESLLFIHSGAEELPIPQEGEERVSLLGEV